MILALSAALSGRTLRVASVATLLSVFVGIAAVADPQPSLSPQASPEPSASASGASGHVSVDPCALLTARDASSVIGAVNPRPQRPSPNQCLWSAASLSHSTASVSQVLFTADVAQEAKHGCHGLGCLGIVQSVAGMIPGLSPFNNAVSEIGGTATTIEGLGQRAAWTNGVLAVLQNQMIFKLRLSGTQADMLSGSQVLARKVLNNLQSRTATPHP